MRRLFDAGEWCMRYRWSSLWPWPNARHHMFGPLHSRGVRERCALWVTLTANAFSLKRAKWGVEVTMPSRRAERLALASTLACSATDVPPEDFDPVPGRVASYRPMPAFIMSRDRVMLRRTTPMPLGVPSITDAACPSPTGPATFGSPDRPGQYRPELRGWACVGDMNSLRRPE